MRGVPWKSQIADGRVFELRSKSKRYPPPCALVINSQAGYYGRAVVGVDETGVRKHGWSRHRGNPFIYVDGIRIDDLPKRISRRRRDLERFDCYDLDLIRYGCAVDFDGRVHSESIPLTRPAKWTVFWIPALSEGDYFWGPSDVRALLRGAWYLENHGGHRHLGYKFGHMWATLHGGVRLKETRNRLRMLRGDLVEQEVGVVRRVTKDHVLTMETRRECPPLGGLAAISRGQDGTECIYVW